MNFKKKGGITLIALVVTIIVLLILAGISISMLTGQNGILNRASEAKENTEIASKDEDKKMQGYENAIDRYVYGVPEGLKVGSTVTYSPSGTYNWQAKYCSTTKTDDVTLSSANGEEFNLTEWKVLSIENGKVELVPTQPTTGKVYLGQAQGYNNGVKLIDDTCSTLYNNTKMTNKVQNLKIEDIEDKMKEKDYSKFNPYYGKAFTYITENRYYPNILLKEQEQEVIIGETIIKGTELRKSEQNEYIEQEKENKEADVLKVKYTYWYKNMEKEDFDNSKYYELFINDGNENYEYYWLSSRCVLPKSGFAAFGIFYETSGRVTSYDLCYSRGGGNISCIACRPVITLNSNVQIDTTNPGNGTESNPYNIK